MKQVINLSEKSTDGLWFGGAAHIGVDKQDGERFVVVWGITVTFHGMACEYRSPDAHEDRAKRFATFAEAREYIERVFPKWLARMEACVRAGVNADRSLWSDQP